MIRAAVVPESRLDRDRLPEDLALLAGLGAGQARITLDWAWLQPKAGVFDGDAEEWYAGVLAHATTLGLGLQFTLLERSVPPWFDNDGGFTDAGFAGHWWPRWVEGVAERFGDAVAGWVPFDNPLAYASRLVPDDPRRHGDVLDTLVTAWRDTWRILRGGPPVATALGVRTVRPVDQTIPAVEAARREDQLRWGLWLQGLRDGTASIPGRADREVPDLAGACDIIGVVVADVDESLGAVLRAAEMGPDRPLAITLMTATGTDSDRVTVIERFEVACGEAAEGAPLQSMAISPTFDAEGAEDGVITRDRDVKDSAAIFFGAGVR
ncbi:MAG TPA: family 1 glycosylhydrolase [Ilumatobacteraceae bacterium]|nr:family 1 glycosylhydrolase [Ilumatobacteraceae bacterium]